MYAETGSPPRTLLLSLIEKSRCREERRGSVMIDLFMVLTFSA
jgi:hypothetical protein